MILILSITGLSIFVSLMLNRTKTVAGIKKGMFMLLNILPTLLTVIILVSILLYLTPQEFYLKYFGSNSGVLGYLFAGVVGSITLIPGFVAYPVCGFLIDNGISYQIIAVFVTTLMMVGTLTIPIEKKYFGLKATLLRNFLSFLGAMIIGLLMGLFWEII